VSRAARQVFCTRSHASNDLNITEEIMNRET